MTKDANAIPRYKQPTWDELRDDEQKTGTCWNCLHMAEVYIGGRYYEVCVCNRDDGSFGEVNSCGPEIRDCGEWDDYES